MVVVAGSCVLLMACAAPQTGQAPAVRHMVKVALVDSFSGAGAADGRVARNGVQSAVDALNAAGGLLGDRVEVVAADGERDPAKTAELVGQQLSDDGVKLLVGPGSSAMFQAARDTILAAGLPNCVTDVADGQLTGAASTFRLGPPDGAQVAALLGAVRLAHPDVRRLGLVGDGGLAAVAADRELAAQAPAAGLAYVGGASDTDATAALQHLADLGAQAVVLADPTVSAARVAQAARQVAQGHLQLLGFSSLGRYDFPGQGGDQAVGAILVASGLAYLTGGPESGWPAGYRTFIDTAAREYGYGPEGVELQASPAAADCVLEWAAAVRRAGTFDGVRVSRAWTTLDLPASRTNLGAHERPAAPARSAIGPDAIIAYAWTKQNTRFRLQQLSTGR